LASAVVDWEAIGHGQERVAGAVDTQREQLVRWQVEDTLGSRAIEELGVESNIPNTWSGVEWLVRLCSIEESLLAGSVGTNKGDQINRLDGLVPEEINQIVSQVVCIWKETVGVCYWNVSYLFKKR
jgi:hypothetical protein